MPRPKLNPTEEQRRLVKSLAAVGIPHEDIARKIGFRSPKGRAFRWRRRESPMQNLPPALR
jgi:hypothetical protein